MAYNLSFAKKTIAVSMLAEGNSIRAIERMTGVHRDTIKDDSGERVVAVLGIPPVDSPQTAVKVAIASEVKSKNFDKGSKT